MPADAAKTTPSSMVHVYLSNVVSTKCILVNNRPVSVHSDTISSTEFVDNVLIIRFIVLLTKVARYWYLLNAGSISTGLDAAASAKEDLSESMESAILVPNTQPMTPSLTVVCVMRDTTSWGRKSKKFLISNLTLAVHLLVILPICTHTRIHSVGHWPVHL